MAWAKGTLLFLLLFFQSQSGKENVVLEYATWWPLHPLYQCYTKELEMNSDLKVN